MCNMTLTLVEEGDAIVGKEGLELHGFALRRRRRGLLPLLSWLRLLVARSAVWKSERFGAR